MLKIAYVERAFRHWCRSSIDEALLLSVKSSTSNLLDIGE